MEIHECLAYRFGGDFNTTRLPDLLHSMAARGSCREFRDDAIPDDLIRTLCAVALSSPTKSDLQQADIILLEDPGKKDALRGLVGDQDWVRGAPHLAVFCGNNRRQRLLHDWRGHPFANDHLDAMFNVAVDAAIVLGAFIHAAEAMGFGCCPISAVRNRASDVSDLLSLPDHVFPVAGLAFGLRAQETPAISPRLPLDVTVHTDGYAEDDLRGKIDAYDARRRDAQPYPRQRLTNIFGGSEDYGWSEDKARQYSQPERTDFGRFLAGKKFKLE